jgi:protease-4
MADAERRRRPRWRRRFLFLLALVLIGLWVNRARLLKPALEEGSYVLVDLQGEYAEEPPDEIVGRLLREPRLSLLDLLLLLRDAREDDRVAGVVVRIRPLDIGWAKAEDIRDALLAYREAGKPVIAYLEQEFGSSTLEYFVASAAERVLLPSGATALLNGLQAQYVFLGGVWEKLDVQMEVEKIREYKTAGDMLANKEMTAAHREMADSLLDAIFERLSIGIAAERGLSPDAVRAAIDASPATGEELEDRGLADGETFLDELRDELLGEGREFTKLAEFRKARRAPETVPAGKLAIIFGVGPVMTGESPAGRFAGDGMGSDSVGEAFREAAADDEVKAIVFRIDSPGGSALASDLIWRAARQARQRKPVIVSMSDVAASGGYYVAAGATRILAQPGSFTGSIGVVLFKPDVSGLLANLGIHTETLARGELAGLTSVTTPMTPAERARIVDSMEHVYDLFLDRVSEGRRLSTEDIDAIGRGRVWTGSQAVENGLVDELGGFFAAIDAAKTAAGIALTEKVALVFLPRPKSVAERLASLLGARVFGDPPPWWSRLRALSVPYRFSPGSILTLMPLEIEVR